MPPYKAVKSKAQSRKLFALAGKGEMSLDDAKGKTSAAAFSKLPERKGRSVKRGKVGRKAMRGPSR